MTWQFSPYAVPLFAGAGLLFVIAIVAWIRRKTTPGAYAVAFLAVCTAIYVLGYAFELSSTRLSDVKIWLGVEYIGMTLSPLVMFYMVAHYTGYRRLARPVNFLLLLPMPLITIVLAWTNDHHELIWQNMVLERHDQQYFVDFTPGGWYWINVVYIWTFVPAGLLLVLRSYSRMAGVHRRQIQIFLGGMLVPLVANFLYLIAGPMNLDIVPYGLTITSLLFAYGVFRYRFLDIMPVAREAVVASMSDAVIVLDSQRRIIDVNPAAQTLFGFHPSSVIGQEVSKVFASWPVILENLCPMSPGAVQQVTLEDARGTACFDMRISPLEDRLEAASGCLVVLRDITDRVRAEQDRERLIQSLDAFAHSVAHDIKNPLSVIVSFSLMLQEDFDTLPEPQIREYLALVSDTGLQISSIVDSLLLFATVNRLEPADLKPVDMAPLIRNVQIRLRDRLDMSQAEINLPASWPRAIGYASWIEEVWMNYISNAVKYGGKPPVVTLGATRQPEGMIRFWVKDNGPGLNGDEQGALFAEFTRLHRDRAAGHGLGLSIVKRIIDKLGGEVGVESTPGEGSCFYFSLPEAP